MSRALLLFVLLTTLTYSCTCEYPTYYVDTLHGNDANSGSTVQEAVRSIAAAIKLVQPDNGGIIALLPGVYFGQNNCGNYINKQSHIEFIAYDTSATPEIACNFQRWNNYYEIFFIQYSNFYIHGIKLRQALNNAIYCKESSNCTVSNVTIQGTRSYNGIDLERNGKSLTVSNVEIYDAGRTAINIDSPNGIVKISNVRISSSKGGIWVFAASTVDISNVMLSKNDRAIYVSITKTTANISNFFVEDSTTYGMRLDKANSLVTNGVITNGWSSADYSSLHLQSNSVASFTNVTVSNNAGTYGGVGVTSGSSAKFHESNISYNTGYKVNGGGGFYLSSGSLQLLNSEVAHNQAIDGGAIYCGSSSVILFQATLTNNYATNVGSIMCNNCPDITCYECTTSPNFATNVTKSSCHMS